jgi:hypothetical protein
MTDATIKDAFDIFIKHREAILQMWQFFSAVTLGVLGFTVGSKDTVRDKTSVKIIIFGYIVFAIANGTAVISSQIELCRMADGLNLLLPKTPLRGYFEVEPLRWWLFLAFYAVVVILVSYAIYETHRAKLPHAP